MPKLFCLKCNQSTTYESSRPSFCSSCGKPFIDITASIPKNFQKLVNYPPVKDTHPIIEDDDDSPVNIPQINKLEYELEGRLRNTEKLSININKQTSNLSMARSKVQKGAKKTKNPSKSEFENQWAQNFPKNSRQNPASLGE